MKPIMYLISMLILLVSQGAHAQISDIAKQDLPATNLVPNGGFENGKARWSTFTTTLSSQVPSTAPAACSSCTITTFAATTGAMQNGKLGLSVAGSAAISAGTGFISNAFTLPPALTGGKALPWTLNYAVASGLANMSFTGLATGTWAVYFYDVTNSVWVQPSGVYNFTGSGQAVGSVQFNSNTTSVRMAVVAITATSGAAGMYFDDAQLTAKSPSYDGRALVAQLSSGSSQSIASSTFTQITGWSASIDTAGGFSNNSYTVPVTGLYRLQYSVVFTSAAVAGSSGYFQTAIYKNGAAFANNLTPAGGTAAQARAGSTDVTVLLKAGDVLTWYVYQDTGSTLGLQNAIGQFASVTRIAGPTAGDEGRVISSKATLSATSGSIASLTEAKVPINQAVSDRGGMLDTVNNRFNISVAGDYQLNVTVAWSTATQTKLIAYRVNGGGSVYIGLLPSGDRHNASTMIPSLKSGDYVEVWVRQDSGAGATLSSGEGNTAISFYRLSGPSSVTANDTVSARFTDSSAQVVASSATLVKFATKDYDSHAAYSSSSGLYTAPTSGKYLVTAMVTFSSNPYTAGQVAALLIYKNGSQLSNGPLWTAFASQTLYVPVSVSDQVQLNAGDTISIYSVNGRGNTSLTTNGQDNRLSITKVAN